MLISINETSSILKSNASYSQSKPVFNPQQLDDSDSTVDLIWQNGCIHRMRKAEFLGSFTARNISDTIEIPFSEFEVNPHTLAIKNKSVASLTQKERVYVRVEKETNNSEAGQLYMAVARTEVDSELPREQALSLNNASLYKATRVQHNAKHELVDQIDPKILSDANTDLIGKNVTIIWYELVGYVEATTQTISWLDDQSDIGTVAGECTFSTHLITGSVQLIVGGRKFGLQQLIHLLDIAEIKHDNSLDGIKAAMASHWRRGVGEDRSAMTSDRWSLLTQRYEKKRDAFEKQFQELGFLTQVKPQKHQFEHALLLGCSVQIMKQRIDTLINSNVAFEHLHLLAGERELTVTEIDYIKSLDNHAVIASIKTEADASQWLFNFYQSKNKFVGVKAHFVVSEHKLEKGQLRRANTEDTIRDWLSQNPHPKTTVIVSSQPFAFYQNQVVRNVVSESGYCPDIATLANPLIFKDCNVIQILNAVDSTFRVLK